MESHFRSLFKAITWRLSGTLATTIIAFWITDSMIISTKIGLADFLFKIFAFYVHERIWDTIPFGRKKKPTDYEI